MTAPAFAAACTRRPVILLPLGSHEDHGGHMPMGDYVLAEALALRIAAAATASGAETFVAPCMPFGVADYFAASPGALALSAAAFRAALADLLAGLRRHGLTKIVILNGHGGNVAVIHEVTMGIKARHGLIIPSLYLWKIARQLMEQRLGAADSGRFGHGAEPLLSLSLALRGGLVSAAPAAAAEAPAEMLGLKVAGFGTLEFDGITLDAPVGFEQVPRMAIETAWPQASAALGAEIAAGLVATAAKFICHVAGGSD